MRAVRDLRELINVSRLSFKESDEEQFVFNYEFSNPFTHSQEYKSDIISNSIPKVSAPILSITSPSKSNSNNKNKNSFESNKSKDLLLERNSILNVSYSLNNKNLLPPLKGKNENNEDSQCENDLNKEFKSLEITKKTDNFDEMLTFIDASVVSEWLNRANRLLNKMHIWHKSDLHKDNNQIFTKYESFILFANFWLGGNTNNKFDHRNRRQLLEMEYSILCDEITQAFQIGIDSQQITMSDIHSLLHAVLREYPLQFLSFRGVYLILDYIETLCSNRNEEYKKVLSDVKCRTLNKQFAQWILSIRSFALINLCWGIIKFYRNLNLVKYDNSKDNNSEITNFSDEKRNLSSASSSSLNASSTRSSSSCSAYKISNSKKINPISEAEFISISCLDKYKIYLDCVIK